MSGENQNEDIVKIGSEQGKLEALRSDEKSPQDLKTALQTYRQVYFSEVNTGKSELTTALNNTDLYQSKEARNYLNNNIAFGLANAVTDLATEGQRIKTAGEEKKEYPTLKTLKDGVKSKLSEEKTALTEYGELEGIRKKLSAISESNSKLSDTATLSNISIIYAQKQGYIKSIEAIENTFANKTYTLASDLQTKLKDRALKSKISIEDDLEDASRVIGARDEYKEANTTLGMIESAIKLEKKPLTAQAYEQYSKELKTSLGEMTRIYDQYNVAHTAGATLGIFKQIGTVFYPTVISPVEKRLTGLISSLEKEKPKDLETKLDPDLQAQLDYDDAQQKVAGFSKELAELEKIEEENKQDPASRLDRKKFEDYSEKVKALKKKYEKFKGSHALFKYPAVVLADQPGYNGYQLQAKFLNVTEKPFLSKLESLEIRNTFTRGSEIDKFEKKALNDELQTIIVELNAQWKTNVTDQSAFLEPAPTTDEESQEFKDFQAGENKLLTFVVSAEAQLNVFLSRKGMIEDANLKELESLIKQARDNFTKISNNRQQREMQKAAKDGETQSHTYTRKTGRKIKKEMIEPSEDPKIRPTTYTIEVDEEEEVTDQYKFSECVEFINPGDPKYSEINGGKGFRFTKDLPEEIQNKMEVEAVLIISSKKESVQAEMSKQKMEILKTGDLLEVGKETLGEKGKAYFAGVEAMQKGDTAAAIASFQEYLTLSATFDENEKEIHQMYIQDAKLQIEALNLSGQFYEGMALMKEKKLDEAIPKLREFITTIQSKPEAEQKKCADQLSAAVEIVKQINSAKLSMLIDLKKDMEFVEVRRIVTNGTPSRSLDKDATGVFRELMLPFVPYDTLTDAEKQKVDQGRGGLQGEEIQLLNRKINDLKKRIDNGEPVDFEEEFGKIKTDLQTFNDKHYSIGGKFKNDNGEERPDWPSERLFDNFQKINSFDAKKREKGFTEIAQFLIDEQSKLGDMKLSMRYSQKYLDKAMQVRYEEFNEEDGGALKKEIRSKMLRDSSIAADINSGALEMYKRWASETNRKLPKSEQYSLDNPDPASLQMFQKQLFESRLKYQFEREVRKKLTDQGEATDGSALKLYNWSLPHDYQNARWYKPWSWEDYNQDDWVDFKEKTKEFVAETLITLPIGMGAGSIGKAVGTAGIRMLAREGISQAAISVIERGGIMALRADAALWKSISVGMRARILAGYGMGVVAEGGSLIVMNSIYEGFSTGRTPEFFHMLEEGNWSKASITMLESIGKAGAFRVIGGASQKMFGNAMNNASTGTKILGILGSESFSGFTGTGIEALSLLAKGQGDQITFDFWAKSLAQNALQSYGTHIAHNTAPKLIDTQSSTKKKFDKVETEIAVQRLADVGIKSPLDLVNIGINSAGEIIFKPTPDTSTEGTYRQPPKEVKIDPTKINIEALPPQIREPLKAKIKEVKAAPKPVDSKTLDTPTTKLDTEPANEKSIGKEKFKNEDINKATGDQPLKPFQADTPETRQLIKTSEDLTNGIETAKTSESQRQNPDATPEHQQSWAGAYLDKLTGLYNRNGFRMAENWFVNSKSIALASFDGDYFGAFNKLKGTTLGDQVIKQMAKNFHELQQQFRDMGIEAMVIREGGEEFTIIARDINSTQMRQIMDNFRQKLQVDTQRMIKSLEPNLQIELIQYLQATGKLPQNVPPEHFLTGDRFKLGPIGGSTVGVADVNLSVRKPNEPRLVLDNLKRHADHALEVGKNDEKGGRNRTYRAPSYTLKQFEGYVADSKLETTRQNPDQPSQAENLQAIYNDGVNKRSERFDDLGKIRGWENVEPIINSTDIQTQANLNRLLAAGKLTAKDIAGMKDTNGQSLAPHTDALLKYQAERLQVMSIVDQLSGVQNESGLVGLLKLRKEQGIPVESYNLDIKLKPINENLGHIGGDAYLMTSAQILSDIIQNLPRDSSDPAGKKFSSKRLSIFRKNPLDGGGFRLIAPEGTLTQQHLEYIAEQYQQRMQKEFFDKIGTDSNGKSVNDGLLTDWINKNSTQPEADKAQLGQINIIKESQAKLDSIVAAHTETNYRARPEDFQYTQMPTADQLPTQPQPVKNASDNQPTMPAITVDAVTQPNISRTVPETINDAPTQPHIPQIAPTALDIAPLMNKSYAESLKQIESGQIDPTPAITTHLVENIGSGDILALLNNSKLKFNPQQQNRLIDRVISDHTLFPNYNKKEPFKVPDEVNTHLKEAVLKGKIDLTNPDVAQRLASYETGQLVLIDLIFNQQLGDNPAAYRALSDQLLTTELKLETLGILLDSGVIPDSLKPEISQKFQQKEQAFADAKLAEYQLSKFSQEFKADLKNLLETDFRNNLDPNAKLLTRLSERDPQGFNILKDNISNLPDTYVQAIIEGRKTEFIDTKGQKIIAYTGNQVGNAGGVGTAFHTAYVSGESTQLKYAVIKKPHENRKEVFRSETAGAELAGNFGSQYINKILHAGKDFAIFETGQNVRSLYQEIQTTSPRQSLILIRQVMEAMQAYRENGHFHGDLKEVNVIVIDGPNGREVRVIDNDPVDPKSSRGQQFAWFRTPGYFENNPTKLGEILTDSNKYAGVWDAYALGAMISTFSDGPMGLLLSVHQPQLGPAANRLLLLGSQLKNTDFATRPDAIKEAMSQLDAIIATLPPDNQSANPRAALPIIDNKTTPAENPTVPGQPLPEQLNL
jgi:diguanylate cyclase (GGDEF)-like protein